MARSVNTIRLSNEGRLSLKDHFCNQEKVGALTKELARVYPYFDSRGFVRAVCSEFPRLELKQRIEHMAVCLHTFLPQDYPQALALILEALPPALDPNKTDGDFGDYMYELYNTYIARYCSNRRHLLMSLNALERTTQIFSAEFAIRTFITRFPKETLAKIVEWSTSENYHVRRLASEGTRPNLPWGGKIVIDNTVRTIILNNLFTDNTRYVVRSVSNHLNDVSKDDLDWVLALLGKWQQSGRQDGKEFVYMVRHALRTALRAGDAQALQFVGYNTQATVKIERVQYANRIVIGQSQEIHCTLTAAKAGKYLIDYVVWFYKKNGSYTTKTFRIKDVYLNKQESIQVSKKHPFRILSTRKLYPGLHHFALQVNGTLYSRHSFELTQ